MRVAKSISAKVTLSVVLVSCVIISAIVAIDAVNVSGLMKQQIRHAAETEADLAFIGIEKPMLVGDNNATKLEFATIKQKFKDMSVYLTSYSGNVTYSTDQSAVRKDLATLLHSGAVVELHRKGLKQAVRETAFVNEDGRDMLARVITIPNEARCRHCHGASQPFVGQLVVLTDVSSQWSLMRQQVYVSVGVGVVGLILLVTASILIIRKICVNAIRCLALLANKVASGDFSVSFHSQRSDENRPAVPLVAHDARAHKDDDARGRHIEQGTFGKNRANRECAGRRRVGQAGSREGDPGRPVAGGLPA